MTTYMSERLLMLLQVEAALDFDKILSFFSDSHLILFKISSDKLSMERTVKYHKLLAV